MELMLIAALLAPTFQDPTKPISRVPS